ncbi:MAG: hypothetical protein CVT99_03860 [Bacteroidetes bacterium HGW-Bacteroidetes-16]|jgi:hypothetical protein|nr:MAG: hypothetical protein CVT99_03860 [Bacteroidetes bacterium HGW-Bacteroidetes-16]
MPLYLAKIEIFTHSILPRTKFLFSIVLLTGVLTSCIKPFVPDIKTSDLKKYVVSGMVLDGDGYQKVNVSASSPINDPQYTPVTQCLVTIIDANSNQYQMTDNGDGSYTNWIDPVLLVPGSSFKVQVHTFDGQVLESDYDLMSKAPEVDSVYFLRKDIEGNMPGSYTLGIQFYLDLKGTNNDGRYYLWNVFETYEYHTDYPITSYYDGEIHQVDPPDYSKNVCWRTNKIPKIFTLSTENLTENKYKELPLQYVDNQTTKLAYGYSVLVEQLALSEAAYHYWDQMRINSSHEGGLYEQQPLAIKGNVHNLTHPDEEVLGFFCVAAVSRKRIFVQNVPNLPLEFSTYCSPAELRFGPSEIPPSQWPAYLSPGFMWLNNECVDCLIFGGINIKPDFWPN